MPDHRDKEHQEHHDHGEKNKRQHHRHGHDKHDNHGKDVSDVARKRDDVIAADSIDAVAAHNAVQDDSDQAELSGESPDAGSLNKFAPADGPTNDEVEAANKGRLAKGEEPVAAASADVLPEEPEEGSEMDIRNTVGEDTMAVRQSAVDRVIDGNIVRAAEDGSPDTMSTTRDSSGVNIKE